ncbi:MAG: phosphatidate cytidylyltransferase [Lachnospiraceae bacterium]|nr:phosphatidate cytidylyltransferase [Lachnospiraceae bacterium]MBP5183626.1 phosphatidate cytidylyltransferase [Lachnospiraceae bacterium]
MFKARLISAVFIVIFTFLTDFFGGIPLCLGMLLVSLQGLFELYRANNIHNSTFAVISYVNTVAIYTFMYFGRERFMIYLLMVSILLYMGIFVFKFPKYTFSQVFVAFGGVFYISVMLMYVYLIRGLDNGIYFVWMIYAGSWGSDVGAYTFGKLFGKHKLVPNLSPKKTVEGAIGGIVASAFWGLLYALIFGRFLDISMPFLVCPCIAAASSVVAQIGDLAASAIKRQCNIKDFGKSIPGHGGILDRYDSIIFVAPLVYFLDICVTHIAAI